jgi:hypothetical protein
MKSRDAMKVWFECHTKKTVSMRIKLSVTSSFPFDFISVLKYISLQMRLQHIIEIY